MILRVPEGTLAFQKLASRLTLFICRSQFLYTISGNFLYNASMFRRAFLLSLALIGASNAALASFDMLMMPSISSGRINRYDPINNVSLGSFNGGTAARLITINQATNRAFVYDTGVNRLRSFNYNTGEILGGNLSSASIISMDYHAPSNRLWHITSTGISRWETSVAFTTSVQTNTASFSAQSGTLINDSVYAVFGLNATNQIVVNNYNASTGAFISAITTPVAVQAGSRLGQATNFLASAAGNTPYAAVTYRDSSGNPFIYRSGYNASNVVIFDIGSQALTGYNAANVTPALVRGHEGFFVVGQDSTTGTLTRIQQFDNSGAFGLVQNTTMTGATYSAGAYQVANVVAPEPTSMIALGLGLIAIAKRRRTAK